MGTTAQGPIHLLELCDQKLLEFVCNVDNKDMVWLEEIEEEAQRIGFQAASTITVFIPNREFSKEPELMPRTPSQKNRRKKRRISSIQDENRDPIRKRLSRRKTRSSQRISRHLRSKDKAEKLATVVGENGSVLRRVTRAAAATAATSAATAPPSPTPGSPTVLTKKPQESPTHCLPVPAVEIGAKERQSAEKYLSQLQSAQAPTPALAPASQLPSSLDEDSTPQKAEAGRLDSVTVSSLMTTPRDPKGRGAGAGRSASKLRIAVAAPGPQGSPSSPTSPWRERVLAPLQPDNFSTPTGARVNRRSVRRSLIAPSSPGPQASLAQNRSPVSKEEGTVRRSSRRISKKAAKEPTASARIICHSYLERLLNVEVPQKVSPKEEEPSKEAEPKEAAEPEVPKNNGKALQLRSTTNITLSPPSSQPAASGQGECEGRQEAETDQEDGLKEPPQSVRRKRSYKQAVSELDEEQQLEDEELQPPRSKTPSPPCPASKVVRPLRTFLHTVQRNQMLMTPTSTPHNSIMKSFIKRNTPLRVDPKEKERQRLENLRRKEEAEQLRRQKVEEDKRRRLEEVKLKREERLRKVLQARERVEQMKEEKKKQIEQKFAQIDEKTEKAKEGRLAEEKARKKAAAKKMEEVEARRKQEEEARRLKWLQQRQQQKLSRDASQAGLGAPCGRGFGGVVWKRRGSVACSGSSERVHKVAREQPRPASRQAGVRSPPTPSGVHPSPPSPQRSCWPSAGVPAPPLQEREKALRLQKERLQRELEEKRKKVTGGRVCGSHGLCAELWAGAAWPQWFGQELLCPPGCAGAGAEEGRALPWSVTACLPRLRAPGRAAAATGGAGEEGQGGRSCQQKPERDRGRAGEARALGWRGPWL
ncbi:hypothetical protein FD754_004387 [Muntiacus muntjak]|uniref:Inner centromere protein n=1 Tax=Muntiacus muntjak TaxID=9888 RepID=A0A5N3WEP6_MUNMU|nr:hypothetical protein FD754_004387 [Muntiacus muntjak]